MVRMTCTDVASLEIETVACILLGVSGFAFQLMVHGMGAAFAGLGFGLLVCALCLFLERVLARWHAQHSLDSMTEGSLGAGDSLCLVSLSASSGFHAPAGFALFCLSSAVYALVRLNALKGSWSDTMPMAPFFLLWFAFSLALCLKGF